jgi:hypothetical protein
MRIIAAVTVNTLKWTVSQLKANPIGDEWDVLQRRLRFAARLHIADRRLPGRRPPRPDAARRSLSRQRGVPGRPPPGGLATRCSLARITGERSYPVSSSSHRTPRRVSAEHAAVTALGRCPPWLRTRPPHSTRRDLRLVRKWVSCRAWRGSSIRFARCSPCPALRLPTGHPGGWAAEPKIDGFAASRCGARALLLCSPASAGRSLATSRRSSTPSQSSTLTSCSTRLSGVGHGGSNT